jgi:hypothetical protein
MSTCQVSETSQLAPTRDFPGWFVSTDGEKRFLKSLFRLIAAQFLCGLSKGLHQILGTSFGYVRHLDIDVINTQTYHQSPIDLSGYF